MAFESGFNSTGPHRINPESVIFAYKNSGIMIDDTRCCSRHLEKHGCI